MDYGAPIQGHGYSSAKHGLVTLTRAFLFSAPYVFDSEGIKCYALAPTGCDTNLVRSLFVKVLLQLTFSHNSLVFMGASPHTGSWVRDPGPRTRDPGPNKCPKG